jgi:hypothetical protein
MDTLLSSRSNLMVGSSAPPLAPVPLIAPVPIIVDYGCMLLNAGQFSVIF